VTVELVPPAAEATSVAGEPPTRVVVAELVPPTPPTPPAFASTGGRGNDGRDAPGTGGPGQGADGTDGGAAYRPRPLGRANISIGTIEVTVVPPEPPAAPPPAAAPMPPVPMPRTWTRAPSLFGRSPAGDRLRGGTRRWYGTAQS
jgi:hypothetical protein